MAEILMDNIELSLEGAIYMIFKVHSTNFDILRLELNMLGFDTSDTDSIRSKAVKVKQDILLEKS